MPQSIFVSGTDTEIGKTFVSRAIVRELIAGGYRVAVMKPVASGAALQDGVLRNEDALQLIAESNVPANYAQVNPYCFVPPIAPHLAAAQAGVEIDLQNIYDIYQELQANSDVVVIEGVGGWRVPLNATQSVADLALLLGLPVVLVVGMRLGCINHALLTAEAIRLKGCQLLGWVANALQPAMQEQQNNIMAIEQRINAPLLGALPYVMEGEVMQSPCLKWPD